MKKYLFAVRLISCALYLCGCGTNGQAASQNQEITEEQRMENELNALDQYNTLLEELETESGGYQSMTVKDGSLSNTGCVVVIENKEDITFPLGEDGYKIEQYVDGKWCAVSLIVSENYSLCVAHEVEPEESWECEINWEGKYGVLPAGKYRIAKPVYTTTYREVSGYLYAEFSL